MGIPLLARLVDMLHPLVPLLALVGPLIPGGDARVAGAEARQPAHPHTLIALAGTGLAALLDDGTTGVRMVGEAHELAPNGVLVTRPFALEPFVEVLPSWNVDVGDGGGFRVEGRFGTLTGELGPWVTFGGWGAEPGSAVTVTSWGPEEARHRVAVDVLEAASPLSRLQLRVVAAGDAALRLEHLTFVTTAPPERAVGLDRSAPAPAADLLLDVPARCQRDGGAAIAHRICSPTSVSMLLEFHGHSHATDAVAALLHDRAHDLYGNWNRAVQGAFQLGCRGRLERMATWGDVESSLRAGHPFAISIRAEEGELANAPYPRTSGHLLVVCGLLADGGVAVRDPAASPPSEVPRTYTRADLQRVWLERNGVAYVLTGPR